MVTSPKLESPLRLPCGVTLKNRIGKSAMSEILGTRLHGPSENLIRLYSRWAAGGAGLLISGNVMIDRRALGEPANVVIEDEVHLEALRAWAAAGTAEGTAFWVQLNHPGKQSPFFLSPEPVAPSAIPLSKGLEKSFRAPRALLEGEIEELVERFAKAAGVAKSAGFTGVQIHGAHGYLVSQFLSPRHNQRSDSWGGSPSGRRRFMLEIYRAIRSAVGESFPVSIKLNSADFSRGGLTEEESLEAVAALASEGIDLVEISGGSYESPAMMNGKKRESTIQREAYFLEFAEKARESVKVPLMLTGGFRSSKAMREAVEKGAVDLVGLARPLAIDPDFPRKALENVDVVSPVGLLTSGSRFLDNLVFINISWYERQLARMGRGKAPLPKMSALRSVVGTIAESGWSNFRRRRS